jgi:6,7-dimethyl-8-ribityllumazine synthase
MQLSMATDIVITNGILTVYDEEQARVRSGEDDRNKGYEVAMAALETVMSVRGLRD